MSEPATLGWTAPVEERRGIFTPELLDRCISCGFCLPACPTFKLTGDETSSPRGRITLMRALESGELADDDETVVGESSFCLGCRACEPVCPAGVQYGALLEEWRDHTWTPRRRPLKLKALLWAVDAPWRVRAMGLLRRHARGRGSAEGPHLMLGCFERALYPKVSRAAQALDADLPAPSGQGCCGALHAHNGELERGKELARALGERLPGTIVTTAGGCAAHLASVLGPERVRELSQWLSDGSARAPAQRTASDAELADSHQSSAQSVAHRARSQDAVVRAAAEHGGRSAPPARPGRGERPLRIGLQDSCHLRNGLGVDREPRALIAEAGEYVELPGAADCCGAAGTYAILRPEDSRAVLDRKLDQIADADLDLVVAVNPGCLRQLEQGLRRRRLRTRAVHLAELLVGRAG